MSTPAMTADGGGKGPQLVESESHVHDETGLSCIAPIRVTTAVCPFTRYIHHFEISLERVTYSDGR
jgi:hypothetical protein